MANTEHYCHSSSEVANGFQGETSPHCKQTKQKMVSKIEGTRLKPQVLIFRLLSHIGQLYVDSLQSTEQAGFTHFTCTSGKSS